MNKEESNKFRAEYTKMSPGQISRVYDEIYLRKDETCFSRVFVRSYFAELMPSQVLEIGGHDGKLARTAIIESPEIDFWLNLEFSRVAIGKTQITTPIYAAMLVRDSVPNLIKRFGQLYEFDTLVLSHILEHITNDEAKEAIRAIPSNIRDVYVEYPDCGGKLVGRNTHVGTLTWSGIKSLFQLWKCEPIGQKDLGHWVVRAAGFSR